MPTVYRACCSTCQRGPIIRAVAEDVVGTYLVHPGEARGRAASEGELGCKGNAKSRFTRPDAILTRIDSR